jgi:hypothetical protein
MRKFCLQVETLKHYLIIVGSELIAEKMKDNKTSLIKKADSNKQMRCKKLKILFQSVV